jgi:hypothetical protein
VLRSIAAVARANGEDLSDTTTQVNCILVFALGGRKKSDDAAECGYFVVRTALAKGVSEAAAHLAAEAAAIAAGRQLGKQAPPALLRFITAIATRFGLVVTPKAAAAAIPVVGAAGGAAINLAFIHHFQKMAEGHFTVRRLERKYGEATVREAYDRISV